MLDEAKLLALSRRVITHFTRPYSQLHVGKGKGQLKEGGTVSAPLAESCRLLRTNSNPSPCPHPSPSPSPSPHPSPTLTLAPPSP